MKRSLKHNIQSQLHRSFKYSNTTNKSIVNACKKYKFIKEVVISIIKNRFKNISDVYVLTSISRGMFVSIGGNTWSNNYIIIAKKHDSNAFTPDFFTETCNYIKIGEYSKYFVYRVHNDNSSKIQIRVEYDRVFFTLNETPKTM